MSAAADSLFDPTPFAHERHIPPTEAPDEGGVPRLRTVERRQLVISTKSLDDLLPPEHEARLIWQYVCTLDLRPLLARIQAVYGSGGRNATDPRILIALWLYATVEGVGSARQLARLCESHDAFRWIAGGVSLNHHTLSDFRVRHEAFLDGLLTRSVAALMHQGLVDLNRVTQDGVRVRASAGSKTFRRHPALNNCLSEARQQVQKLKQERQDTEQDSDQPPSRRERSLEERERRLTKSLEELERLEAHRRKGQKPARCSTTDPEARIMKMACGGFRPAYNVQFATDQASGVVAGVDVVNVGSDKGQMGPMYDQLERRYGRFPKEYLADGDFQSAEDIDRMSAQGTDVYLPLLEWKEWNLSPGDPGPRDTPAMGEVRRRMASEAGKKIYRTRASTSEWVNAQCRNRGLQQFVVRGLRKVRCIACWHALAHNVLRMIGLGVLQPG